MQLIQLVAMLLKEKKDMLIYQSKHMNLLKSFLIIKVTILNQKLNMYIFKNLIYFKMKGKGNRPIYFTKGKVTDKHNIKKY